MIIALLEDGGVIAHQTLADAQREHEGIDVEDRSVIFFQVDGRRLQPVFTRANVRGSFLVASGEFRLEPAELVPGELLAAVDGAAYLEKTSRFGSLADLRTYLAAEASSEV